MEKQAFNFTKGQTIKHSIVYLLLFLAGDFLSSIPFDLLFSIVELPIRALYSIIRMTGCLMFTYFLFWMYTTKVLHLQMCDFRITCAIKKWGVLFGILLPAFVVFMYSWIGKGAMNEVSSIEIIWIVFASAITALKAGILEEMLFRGFIMKLLEERWKIGIAVVVPSFLFSLLHIPSMETFTLMGVLCLLVSGTLVGIMFSLVAYKGNSISNSAVVHGIWNFIMITDILHITTLQGAYGSPIFSITIPSSNILLTGGGFGIEASLIAIIGYICICGCCVFLKRK